MSGYFGTYTITSPTVDSTWNRGAYHSIQWTYSGSPGAYTTISLYNNASLVSVLTSTATTSSGSYSGLLPASLASGNKYRIVVSSYYDATISDTSGYFTVVSGYSGTYAITSPTVDSTWSMGAYHYIQWTYTGSPGAYVNIYLYNGSTYVSTIASMASNSLQSYDYYIPTGLASGNRYRFVISSYYDATISDTSAYFAISSGYSGTYTITSPTVDSIWNRGAYHYIQWTYTGSPGAYVNIYLYNDTTYVSTIATDASNSGSYDYYIPTGLASGNRYRFVISSYYDAAIRDTGAYFTISSGYSGTYTITSPTPDSSWSAGSYHYIQWAYSGSPGAYVNIYLYNGTTYVSTIATGTSNSNGSYDAYFGTSLANGTQYRIVISSYYDASISDTSGYFSIVGGSTPDAYEPDGSAASAKTITTDGVTQSHTLTSGDYDWMVFNAVSGTTYTMETFGSLDTYMYLYGSDGVTEITYDDDGGGAAGTNAVITWTCTTSGMYYMVVRGFSTAVVGPYTVSVTHN